MASSERDAHVVDAPFLQFNIAHELRELKTQDQWLASDRNAITLVKTQAQCVILIAMREGAEMSEHSAPGPITLQVIEGALQFKVGFETYALEVHGLVSLEKEIKHTVHAETDCAFLLTIRYQSA
jgi:quercetin dioxygenase-like cupin family protein